MGRIDRDILGEIETDNGGNGNIVRVETTMWTEMG